ncbi:uncharacterized protein LOC143013797 isoform X3 [Genypterus blacodes]|uniref:uncharacterized protein LOC143013797 isoform X3 n=1 Tax=Genypterus blacodes TaxID=154954 RepID=UPI003F773AEC
MLIRLELLGFMHLSHFRGTWTPDVNIFDGSSLRVFIGERRSQMSSETIPAVLSRITLSALQACKLLCVDCVFAVCCQTSDDSVVKPVVSVYPAVPTAQLQGRSTLLCLASGMSPPLVRFSWKRQKENGSLEELPAAQGGEQLELREPGRAAAIRIVRHEAAAYRYVCYVRHEADTVEAQTAQEVPASEVPASEVPAAEVPASEVPAAEVPASEVPASEVPASEVPASEVPASEVPASATHPESQQTHEAQPDLTLQSECRVKLLCVLYSVLMMKSLVYCCGVSLLLLLTGQQSSSRLTHAD